MILKASGEEEAFDSGKLLNSLRRAGTPENLAREIAQDILSHIEQGMTTRAIYKKAFDMLRKRKRSNAARYSLKIGRAHV